MIGIGEPKLTLLDRAFIARNLSLLITSGTGLAEAIGFLADQPKDAHTRTILKDVHTEVQSGISLHIAIEKHIKSFGGLFVHFVQIGEQSGKLEETLQYLARQYERDHDITKKIRGVLVYPAILLGMIVAYAIGFSYFILPRLQDLFSDFHTKLPGITQALLSLMGWMRSWGLFLIAFIIVVMFILHILKNQKHIVIIREFFLFHVPGFSAAYKEFMLARLFHILAFMIQSGTPIAEALESTADAMTTLYMKTILREIQARVSSGESLTESMKAHDVFPSVSIKLIETAETSGSLEQTLGYLGTYYERTIDYTSKNVSSLLEPILLIAVGIAVALLAIAIILPIYQFTGSISVL
jgi:type IV pilus assembly protein PilC